ncbi:O-antigen ligase family protein [Flavobacterium sp. ZT3R18]|uniref:O-antigen ligase family protein n=1 Tax=Flavobacterium sp. ZT3R18 TaxID=2594429 RepID=UPI00117AE27B|nr:O-antigen ligase family protein [Flavobacterium sp. ZT3R18]TRX34857.1 O-antigen ligase family protein [Flavobacterium sp. ZT3R18]
MKKQELYYIYLILFHAFIGVLVFLMPFLSKLYTILILGYGTFYIIKNKNKNNEALVISAYVIGVEVLLRMTDGMLLNEFGKFAVMFFMFLGMIFSGFSKRAYMYWLFLGLLIPSIILTAVTTYFEFDIKKEIFFNITGPVCLGICAIYCHERKITFDRLKGVITAFCLPLVAIVVYLYLYTPSVKDVISGTQSNFETSGGFGPNQVSTILGLGIFVFFVQFLLNSKNKILALINAGFVLVFAFRGIVTFSRGGVMTAVIMIVLLLMVLYFQANFNTKPKIGLIIVLSFLAGFGVWGYSSAQTGGLINKRYANQDARGREKNTQLSGREDLMASEIQMFLDNPIFGVGVGRNKIVRKQQTGIVSASHNELTRMLAEHGSLGIIDLLILFFTPIVLYLNDRQNIFALSFLAFWLLTINHAAMRLAAPAFVYALSLLKVYHFEKPTLHRE